MWTSCVSITAIDKQNAVIVPINIMSNVSSAANDESKDSNNNNNNNNVTFVNLVHSVEDLLYNLESSNDQSQLNVSMNHSVVGHGENQLIIPTHESGVPNYRIQLSENIQNQFISVFNSQTNEQSLSYDTRDFSYQAGDNNNQASFQSRSHSSNDVFRLTHSSQEAEHYSLHRSLDNHVNRRRSENDINMSNQNILLLDSLSNRNFDSISESEILTPPIRHPLYDYYHPSSRTNNHSSTGVNNAADTSDKVAKSPPDSLKQPKSRVDVDIAAMNDSQTSSEFAMLPTSDSTITEVYDMKLDTFINKSSFPQTLYKLLDNAESEGYDQYVSWQSHGRAFRVHDPLKFVSHVMPLFFHQTRFPSFQRQLSLYGYTRMTKKGKDHGAYYHEKFIRGYPQLCQSIQRTPVKSNNSISIGIIHKSSREEPDFYA